MASSIAARRRLRDKAYRDHVFASIEREDAPRPLLSRLSLLRQAGFAKVEMPHKNGCFAPFGTVQG